MTTLEKLKSKKHIDVMSELTRQKVITPGAGQIATYQEKAEQALEFAAAGYPPESVADYPFIAAEAEALSQTPEFVANRVLASRAAWITIGAAIERIRLGAKKAIDEAETAEDVHTLTADAVAALHQLTL